MSARPALLAAAAATLAVSAAALLASPRTAPVGAAAARPSPADIPRLTAEQKSVDRRTVLALNRCHARAPHGAGVLVEIVSHPDGSESLSLRRAAPGYCGYIEREAGSG